MMPNGGLLEDGGCRLEFRELLEAVIRPLLREQERSLLRAVRVLLERPSSNPDALADRDLPASADAPSRERASRRASQRGRPPPGLAEPRAKTTAESAGALARLADRRAVDASRYSLGQIFGRNMQLTRVRSFEAALEREILSGLTRKGDFEDDPSVHSDLHSRVRSNARDRSPRACDGVQSCSFESLLSSGVLPKAPARSVTEPKDVLSELAVSRTHSIEGTVGARGAASRGRARERRGPGVHQEFFDLSGAEPGSQSDVLAHGPGQQGPWRKLGKKRCRGDLALAQLPLAPPLLLQSRRSQLKDGAKTPESIASLERVAPGDKKEEKECMDLTISNGQGELQFVSGEVAATPSGYLRFTDEHLAASGRFHVHLSKEEVCQGSRWLGLEVATHVSHGLLVAIIYDGGLISAWNARQAGTWLQVGDLIVEVNGQTEDLRTVLSEGLAGGEALDIAAVSQGAGPLDEPSGSVPDGGSSPQDAAAPEAAGGARAPRPASPSAAALPGAAARAGSPGPLQRSGRRPRAAQDGGSPRSSKTTSKKSSGTEPPRGESPRRLWPGAFHSDPPRSSLQRGRPPDTSDRGALWRKGSDNLLALPTVQSVRQQRENGLVEAMVLNQFASPALSSPVPSLSGADSEGHVSAPLWLRVCGTLPWGRRGAGYGLLVLGCTALAACFLAFAVVYVQVGPCDREVCLGYVQITDLALAIGSVLGLLALRSLASLGILGTSESILVAYARRQDITEAWSAAMSAHSSWLALLWACSVVLRGVALVKRSQHSSLEAATLASFAVVSLVFMGIVNGILHVSCALTMIIDSYVAHFDGKHFKLDTSVYEWNLLQAVLRKVSGAVEKGFLIVQSTALALATGVILAAREQLTPNHLHHEPDGLGDVAWLFSVGVLVASVLFIFFKAAEVSERCMRMPALINSLNLGKHVDTRRHYLVEFVSYSAAGFYVGEVRLTAAIALKLTYFGCILAFAGLSQLYVGEAS